VSSETRNKKQETRNEKQGTGNEEFEVGKLEKLKTIIIITKIDIK